MKGDVRSSTPTLVIAGVSSGVGKTTVVAALAAAFRARGLEVASYKVGPDYLDPGYHRLATGRACHNLDGWMMGKDAARSTFSRTSGDVDLALVEGVMGLFDGASPTSEVGSTAELANWLKAPVLLVADAGGLARSIVPLFAGFRDFDPELNVVGLIANRVGSRGHLELLERALERAGQSLFGGLPKALDVSFPARHLGLVTASDQLFPKEARDRLATWAEDWFDLDRMFKLAQADPVTIDAAPQAGEERAVRARIGVAYDEAFHFYYEENFRLLEAAGAELVKFSPLHDTELPAVDGLIFGGGFPELHAEVLSSNGAMLEAIRAHADQARPVYGECGGLMYLSESIQQVDGTEYSMLGLIGGRAEMRERRQALGYVEVELQSGVCFGRPGTRFRGHQFRYSELVGAQPGRYRLRKRRGGDAFVEGYGEGSVLGSYVHAHWASHPALARYFVDACEASRSGSVK